MVVNPNSFRVGYFGGGNTQQPDPSFFDTLGASLGYSYAPLYNSVTNSMRYQPQDGYNWRDDIEGYEMFAPQLYHATSPQHMSALKQQIEESASRRQVLQNSSMLAQFGAGIFDPINLVALPFGGPAVGIGRSALRVGAGTAALEAGLELARQSDPLQTAEEGAINVLSAGLFGAGFGAAFGGINARAYANSKATIQEEMQLARRLDLMGNMTPDMLQTPRAERRFGNDPDDYLQEQINMFEREAARAEAESIAYEGTPQQSTFAARAEEQRAYAQALKQEQGIRELEALGVDLDDPFRIMNSAYTDSFLYKAVTTPMKRALQSKYPTAVKEAFVKSFGDSGIALALNSVGLATPQSVHQRSAVNRGKFVRAHDQLLNLWRSETNAVTANKLDIDLGILSRRLGSGQQTYKQWLTTVNEKRIKNAEDMTENEINAAGVINKYFEDAQVRLENAGLIGTQKGVNTRISQLEAKIEDLNARLVVAEGKRTAKGRRQAELLKGQLNRLGNKLAGEKQTRMALDEARGTQSDEDVFFPRFWDKGQIRKRRKEFSDTLYTWYKDNPYIYEMDTNTAQFVKIKLDTRPEKIQERVDLTIDRILGEKDPTNVDSMGFGYGRSKHFRHRQVDVPNKLVTDFIVTDPLAAMKTYAARVEPRIEYANMFGQDVDGVMFDLEFEMIEKGASDKDINKMRRDYMHLYDRVAGAVLRDPDTFSQKAAAIMRDAASLNYLGSAGLAALPDFSRIIMEHDMENVIRGMQTIMDKNKVNLAVNETRYAGEAIDILMGSAHMRLHDDLSNNLDANELLNNARNAFHIMNGLGPMTVIAKQLAGIVDAHTIIDYSIRYGKLTDQERTWLAKYSISQEQAAKIAKSPWEKTDNGLYLANTDAWTDLKMEDILEEVKKTYKPSKRSVIGMSEKALLNRYANEFYVNRIITDPAIVQDVLRKNGYESGGIGYSQPFNQEPSTVYIDFDAAKEMYERIARNPRSKQESRDQFNKLLEEGKISEEKYYHSINILDNLDQLQSADDFAEFVLLHELHHTTMAGRVGESVAEYENRIDIAAFAYMRDALEEGQKKAATKLFNERMAEAEETSQTFKSALNSGVLNTIMAATPADKPIINDGVVYLPSHIGRMFGFKEDARFKGYTRIENGFLGLPFQFYSYMLANVNKTVGAFAQGQIKNRLLGVGAAFGLAYMSLSIRTPDYVWNDMNWRDRFARTFDMSGVGALYSDIFYTAMHTSLALGGPNITNGIISPKFPQKPSTLDAITGLAGAGPSWTADTAGGIYQFATGEYGEGARTVVRNLPFARMWFLKDDINQITRAWAQ